MPREAVAAEPARDAVDAPVARPSVRTRLRRISAYWFPKRPVPARADGLLVPPGRERWGYLVAVLLALAAAALYEHFSLVAPVPPGGDEGSWLVLSYPYVGLPFPTQAVPWTYPPASMPFLGLSVIAAGGPLGGARLFAGLLIVGLGVSLYEMGRSLFQLRTVALVVEATLFVQPDFQQLYYFGSFPNMFGLIFFFLAIAYAARFVRSRRDRYLALFWVSMTIAVLAHELVAVFLLGLVLTTAVLLLLYQRLPRELFVRPAGYLGLAGFGAATLAYYEGTRLAKTATPNYTTTASLAQTMSRQLFPTVLKPFYLQNFSSTVNGSGFAVTPIWSLELVLVVVGLLLGVFLFVRWARPRLVEVRHILLAAWLISVFGVAIACWVLGLGADYRRFAYFLYPLTIVSAGLGLDLFLSWLLTPPLPVVAVNDSAPLFRGLRPGPWSPRDPSPRPRAVAFVLIVLTLLLLTSTLAYTVPQASSYAKFFTATGHDGQFVSAMQAISASTVSGAIYSSTESVDRWPATLTARNVFEARAPTGFTYTPSQLLGDEEANLALSYRYTVTNGHVAASIPGVTPAYFNASPVMSIYLYGVLYQVLSLTPQNIFVGLGTNATTSIFTKGVTPAPQITLPTDPTNATLTLTYPEPGYEVVEQVATPPGTDQLSITLSAISNGSVAFGALRTKLTSATGSFSNATALGPTGFSWFTNTTGGNVTSFGNLTSGALTAVVPANATTGRGTSVSMQVNATIPVPVLSLSFTIAAPGTSNPTSQMSGFFSTPALFETWGVRFALLSLANSNTGSAPKAFYMNEYGGTVFWSGTLWVVLLLPVVLGPG